MISIVYEENEHDFDKKYKRLNSIAELKDLDTRQFESITELDISGSGIRDNNIGELVIPPNLEKFECSCCYLSKLPKLPKGLKELRCVANNLSYLPDDLPESLEAIWCNENKMVDLFENYETVEFNYMLPNLKTLCCHHNPLTYIPCMPDSLTYLSCKNCSIESFSKLSNSLNYMDCSDNKLTYLEDLPESLEHLICTCNKISEISKLPSRLMKLECNGNYLNKLPELPKSLYSVNCSHNYLKELPELPEKLVFMYCKFNMLQKIPILPLTLQEVYISYNNIFELPDMSENRKMCEFLYWGNPIHDRLDINVGWNNRKPVINKRKKEGIELNYKGAKKRQIETK
mgnify:FL=1|jgi:Leucine-rich repeat (LRR) protein